VVVAVGADHVGQHLGVPRVRFPPRRGVPVTIPGGRHGIHREHHIAGRNQGGDEEAPVGLDPDHHLARVVGVRLDELVEPADTCHPLREPATGETAPVLVLHEHVVMGLSPVTPTKII